jgi:hypothetical protein
LKPPFTVCRPLFRAYRLAGKDIVLNPWLEFGSKKEQKWNLILIKHERIKRK